MSFVIDPRFAKVAPLRSHVSAGSHQRHPQTTLRHRPGPLHQVRHLPRKMQVRRNQHPLTTPPRQIRMETIKLTIDNRTAEVAPGTNLVEAAASVGIKIPTLCYLNLHELGCKNDPGVCRICVVEVEGRKNLAPACKTVCTEGWSSAPTHPASSRPANHSGADPLGPPQRMPHLLEERLLQPANHGQRPRHPRGQVQGRNHQADDGPLAVGGAQHGKVHPLPPLRNGLQPSPDRRRPVGRRPGIHFGPLHGLQRSDPNDQLRQLRPMRSRLSDQRPSRRTATSGR